MAVSFLLVLVSNLSVGIASFFSGLTGFGQGIIFQMLWAICSNLGVQGAGDLSRALSILTVCGAQTSLQLSWAALKEKQIQWRVFWALLPGQMTLQFLGTYAVSTFDQDVLKKGLGVFFFCFACVQIYQKLREVYSKRVAYLVLLKLKTDERLITAQNSSSEGTAVNSSIPANDSNTNDTNPTSQDSSASSTAMSSPPIDQQLRNALISSAVDAVEGSKSLVRELEDKNKQPLFQHASYEKQPHHTNGHADLLNHSSHSTNDAESSSAASGHEQVNGHLQQTREALAAQTEQVMTKVEINESIQETEKQIQEYQAKQQLTKAQIYKQYALSLLSTRFYWTGFMVGCIGGFLQGCFGTGGPPLIIWFTMIDISKGEIRGTFALLNLVLIPIKFISALAFGLFDWSDWFIYLTVPFLSYLGVKIGQFYHNSIDVTMVLLILQILVLLSTVPLTNIFSEYSTPFGIIMLILYSAVILVFIVFFLYLHYRKSDFYTSTLTTSNERTVARGIEVEMAHELRTLKRHEKAQQLLLARQKKHPPLTERQQELKDRKQQVDIQTQMDDLNIIDSDELETNPYSLDISHVKNEPKKKKMKPEEEDVERYLNRNKHFNNVGVALTQPTSSSSSYDKMHPSEVQLQSHHHHHHHHHHDQQQQAPEQNPHPVGTAPHPHSHQHMSKTN